jgi:hypothetical protein
MRRAYDELLGMTDPVEAADLDWTILRFTAPKHTQTTPGLDGSGPAPWPPASNPPFEQTDE